MLMRQIIGLQHSGSRQLDVQKMVRERQYGKMRNWLFLQLTLLNLWKMNIHFVVSSTYLSPPDE